MTAAKNFVAVNTPDDSIVGFLDAPPDPLRYERANVDPDEVAAKIANHVPSGSRVLDVGCGTGCITEFIKEQCAADICGIEPDADRVERARQRGLKVEQGYLTSDL